MDSPEGWSSRHLSRWLAVAFAGCGLWFTACRWAALRAPAYAGPKYTSKVRIESIARGVGVKVNGVLVASQLPADVTLEVGADGLAIVSYTISLNRNILPNAPDDRPSARAGDIVNASTLTIDPGQALPARIRFDGGSPVVLGTARVDRPR